MKYMHTKKKLLFNEVLFFYRLSLDYHKMDLQIRTNLSAKLPSFCFVMPI